MAKKIGLVLGSGVARGLSHIGVLKVLDENKINVDFIAGTSIGALIGAIYASGVSAKEIEEIALNIDKIKTITLFAPTISHSGLIDGNKIIKFIESIIDRQNISDLNIPFAAVATDIMTGEEVVITKGSLLHTLRASISIPGIFTPAKYNGKFLVDGGLVNPVPVSVALNMSADILIAVNVIPSPQKKAQNIKMKEETRKTSTKRINSEMVNIRLSKFLSPLKSIVNIDDLLKKKTIAPNVFNIILQTIAIAEYQIAALQLAKYKPDFLITPSVEFIKPIEFFRAEESISAGEEAIIKILPEIKRKLEE